MLAIQAALVGMLCWLGSVTTPFMGFTGGWYILSRPLVGGFLCGIIFGDIQQGILLGAAVQAAYLAVVTPGGAFPAELGFISYPAMGLALAANMDTGMAIALAASIGVLGTFILNFTIATNSFFNGLGDKAIEKGDEAAFKRAHILFPQLFTLLVRAVPTFLAIFFGAQYIEGLIASLPPFVITGLLSLGGLLPAVGIATLLYQSVKEKYYVLFFLFGFVAIVGLKLSIIQLTIVALVLAFLFYRATSDGRLAKEEVL
jgi:PTS system mannose-specific IIC component